MAEYTRCRTIEEFKDHGAGQDPAWPLLKNGAMQGLVGALIGAAGGAGVGAAIYPPLAVPFAILGALWGFSLGFVMGLCEQWLEWRLVCIDPDEQCAAGQVAWIEYVSEKFSHGTFDGPIEYLFDNDLSFNLRLTPYNGLESPPAGPVFEFPVGSDKEYGLEKIEADEFPSSRLLSKPGKAAGAAWNLNYEGYEGTDKKNNPGGRWSQHCEIEGNGMSTLCAIGKFLAGLYPIMVFVSVIVGAIGGAVIGAVEGWNAGWSACRKACSIPILCDLVCFVAALVVAIVGAIVGLVIGAVLGAIPGVGQVAAGALLSVLFRHNGDFSDVANDPESGRIDRDDCVFVSGMHVYDGGHPQGWGEIHPVRHLQKVPPEAMPEELTGTDRFRSDEFMKEVTEFWNTWCALVKEGKSPEVKTKQDRLVNRWCVHPQLDGCAPHGEGAPAPAGAGEVIH